MHYKAPWLINTVDDRGLQGPIKARHIDLRLVIFRAEPVQVPRNPVQSQTAAVHDVYEDGHEKLHVAIFRVYLGFALTYARPCEAHPPAEMMVSSWVPLMKALLRV